MSCPVLEVGEEEVGEEEDLETQEVEAGIPLVFPVVEAVALGLCNRD